EKTKLLDSFFRQLTTLREPKTSLDTGSRLFIATERRIFDILSESDVGQLCEVVLLEESEDLPQLIEGYEEIVLVSDHDLGSDVMNLVVVSPSAENLSPEQLIPEKVITYFSTNRLVLLAASNLAEELHPLRSHPLLDEVLADLDMPLLGELSSSLERITDTGEVDESSDEDYNRLYVALANLDTEISESEAAINTAIQGQMTDTKLEIGGDQLLSLLKDLDTDRPPSELRGFLEDELYENVEEILIAQEEKLKTKLGLSPDEAEMVEELFPRAVSFPIEVLKTARERLEQYLRQKMAARGFELKGEIAQNLTVYREICVAAVKALLELDYAFMIGKFSQKYKLVLPKLSERIGVGFEGGYNLRLLQVANGDDSHLEPVSYAFGDVDIRPASLGTERIVLLSGANSGGKTTLIQNIAFSAILAHMGLGVPVQVCEIGLLNEFHFFEKATGQTDAGAFESTLNLLSSMLLGADKKLILADEMESISEPGASARVISAYLDMLFAQPNSSGVFVTHLAPEIRKVSKQPIRIDGIEAEGLDENLQLIVNRSPKYYKYARSTPQLIVERLYRSAAEGELKDIFSEVLSRFDPESIESADLAVATQVETFSTTFKETSAVYKDISSEGVQLDANVEQILALYVALMEQVFDSGIHVKVLVLLHGEKKEWTREEITRSLGFQPAAVLRALQDLHRAGLINYNEHSDRIALKQRLYH
ncbi:MAG: MutS-related protein, partial [Candidatus Hodarchaeales archaeon]